MIGFIFSEKITRGTENIYLTAESSNIFLEATKIK